ncbi:5738_t:CDS:1, partial [Gigaspora margarita]
YLKSKFAKWTSGNEKIDRIIKCCQSNLKSSFSNIEWIPYDQFENRDLLTSSEHSKIYIATWTAGSLLSRVLRTGIPIAQIVQMLSKIFMPIICFLIRTNFISTELETIT